jgi:hypothetical protein
MTFQARCRRIKRKNIMLEKKFIFIFFIFTCATSLPAEPANINEPRLVKKFDYFEQELVSQKTFDNPYTDVWLTVIIETPSGNEWVTEGFWDGGKSWKIRIMPTETGQWRFFTASNAPGLDGVSGQFLCTNSDHPGLLRVSQKYPSTFELSAAGPFFWFGETSWCLMSDAVPFADGTFQQYVTTRKLQRFNGIHFVLGTGGLPDGTHNPRNEGGLLWISQDEQKINPDFFKWMDQRVAYLDALEMALGFFITWAQHFATFELAEYERLERYLIARYAAFPLIYWVIVGEFDEVPPLEAYISHGNLFLRQDPYGHLISNHPGHSDSLNIGTSRIYANQNWFSFLIQQYPAVPGTATPAEINQYVLNDRKFGLPVVNIEFGYEDQVYAEKVFTRDETRKSAWAVALAGGFFSYGHAGTIRKVDLTATASAGVLDMQYLRYFFDQLEWWKMTPANSRVDTGFCLAQAPESFVIYLPDSGQVKIDLREFSDTFEPEWFNPQTGEIRKIPERLGGNSQVFISPFVGDAVLRLQRSEVTKQKPLPKGAGILPNSSRLFQNFPNPFNHATTIQYRAPGAASVYLKIFNTTGQQIRSRHQTISQSGIYAFRWLACDDAGAAVPSGIYLCQLEIFPENAPLCPLQFFNKIIYLK